MHRGHLAIVGPTASGKSALSMEVARRLPDIEIVCIDSMQVYRGMDIGSAKPTAEDRAEIPHHLLDLADPDDDYTVVRFQSAFREVVAGIDERGHRALLVGGSALHLRAVIDELQPPGEWPDIRRQLEAEPDTDLLYARLQTLDPAQATKMERGNRRRIIRALEICMGSGARMSEMGPGLDKYEETAFHLVGVALPRDVVTHRIVQRLVEQMAAGFLDEVRRIEEHPGFSRTSGQALGYRELRAHLRGDCSLESAVDLAIVRTRRFAKRQEAWFRRDPRIVWLRHPSDPAQLLPELLAEIARTAPTPT